MYCMFLQGKKTDDFEEGKECCLIWTRERDPFLVGGGDVASEILGWCECIYIEDFAEPKGFCKEGEGEDFAERGIQFGDHVVKVG
jgi:hypothetical protein